MQESPSPQPSPVKGEGVVEGEVVREPERASSSRAMWPRSSLAASILLRGLKPRTTPCMTWSRKLTTVLPWSVLSWTMPATRGSFFREGAASAEARYSRALAGAGRCRGTAAVPGPREGCSQGRGCACGAGCGCTLRLRAGLCILRRARVRRPGAARLLPACGRLRSPRRRAYRVRRPGRSRR